MIERTQLRDEILSGPLAAPLALLVDAGNDAGIAMALNDPRGPAAGTVLISPMPVGDFLLGIIPAVAALPGKTADLQAKWDRFLGVVRSVPSVRVADPAVQALLAQLVADGLMSQAQVDAFTRRPGSRAEILWASGALVTGADVAAALRG